MMSYENAKKTICAGFEFLDALGFAQPSMSIEQSKLLGDSLLMVYTSVSAQRRIEVSYVANNTNRAAAISVFICDFDGERFSLEDWAGENVSTSLRFLADSVVEEERTFLDQVSLGCRKIIEGPLRDTVTGKEWNSVALNWKGYR